MTKRQRISVVIIVKNEANLLLDCLNSVSWADEIILLYSGRDDTAIFIAQKYRAKIIKSQSWQGYGRQRQKAQTYASGDMILMIDADERVTPELHAAIEKVLESTPKLDKVYSFGRINLFLGRFMRHSGWYPDYVVRFYPRIYRYNDRQVHESLEIGSAQVIALSGYLQHLTCLDFSSFRRKQVAYAKAWAHQYFQSGKRCSIFSIFIHTLWAFLKTLLVRAGFLDGRRGWILAIVNAQYTFSKYAALWILGKS